MTMPASAVSEAPSPTPSAAGRPGPTPGVAALARTASIIWPPATLVAALGTWTCFDATPGLNWALWSCAAALGLAWVVHRSRGRIGLPVGVALALACALASCMAVTADFDFAPIIMMGVAVLLSLGVALAEGVPLQSIGPIAFVVTPVACAARSIREAALRLAELASLPGSGSERAQARVRGVLLAIPVVGVLALLLSGADPVLARLRDEVIALGNDGMLVPRLVFFLGLGALTVGAYGISIRRSTNAPARPAESRRTLGETERFVVLASVSALFALFLGLQVSYFFGNVAGLAGSGVTYAEYTRKGFGEITVAATAATLLIVFLDHHAARSDTEARTRVAGLVLIFLVQLLLDSAYHRVALYESAYGYTAARLYARVYMIIVSLALMALGIEMWTAIDAKRLARRVALMGAVAVIGLCVWNHEAWIARKNIDAYTATRFSRLDTEYLLGLSPNAVPEIVSALPRLPQADRDSLYSRLVATYVGGLPPRTHWYEWNLRAAAAERALASIGITSERARPTAAEKN